LRLLLDENLPRQLAALFRPEHDAETVRQRGWTGTRNGRLLRQAEAAGFDAFVTTDKGIEHQQNLPTFALRIVLMRGFSNRIEALGPLVPNVKVALETAKPGRLVIVGDAGRRSIGEEE